MGGTYSAQVTETVRTSGLGAARGAGFRRRSFVCAAATSGTMVEGHGVHRVAQRHRRLLLGKVFKATSPNGRFAQGAKLIDDRTLSRIEAIGKNLFYFWGDCRDGGKNTTVVHIHFGMSGQFKTAGFGKLEATKNTRLELASESDDIVAHLSAMTVNHGDMEFYDKKVKALGQDPLREDADADLVWEAFKKSRKSVGMLLMDQSVIAGLGNIYRAEVLFKAGLHPETPGASIDHETLMNVWQISKDFLRRGVETGSILTVDPQEAKVLGPPWTRRYIYNHSQCGRCGTRVKTWVSESRALHHLSPPVGLADLSFVSNRTWPEGRCMLA